MHTKGIVCAVAALAMGFGGPTYAEPDKDMRADHAQRDEHRAKDHGRDQQHGRGQADRAHSSRRDADRRQHESERRHAEPDRAGHHFNRGDHLPVQYRERQYVVDNWRSHRLSAPPRGYQWVQANGDFLLVAIASGVIVSILLNQ